MSYSEHIKVYSESFQNMHNNLCNLTHFAIYNRGFTVHLNHNNNHNILIPHIYILEGMHIAQQTHTEQTHHNDHSNEIKSNNYYISPFAYVDVNTSNINKNCQKHIFN
jgi:hypothetical protein